MHQKSLTKLKDITVSDCIEHKTVNLPVAKTYLRILSFAGILHVFCFGTNRQNREIYDKHGKS